MNHLVHERTANGEADLATASREVRARKAPDYDVVCFHSQQWGEKHLKARLRDADVPFGRTHNLVVLQDSVLGPYPDLGLLRSFLQVLSTHAVQVRYPAESADLATAKDALRLCKPVRSRLRSILALDASA